ncbi:hypothetical protein MOQ_003493 [Trypanosoma cruzi marinkellei]|uniref:Uncharacterized protein n=1 Tax=Trypanosoma cruzi marinkellei TaxID=85056 RepID=K2NUM2_TRYCR|nr:hypothetical protein MOQ_003493 [Trypanosoma cruzi marinkellei]
MTKTQSKSTRQKRKKTTSMEPTAGILEKKDDVNNGRGDILLETRSSPEASNPACEISLKSAMPPSSKQCDGAKPAYIVVQEGNDSEVAEQAQFLHVHFFLSPIMRGSRGTPSMEHLTPRLQKIVQSVVVAFPPGTTFEVRREVRINGFLTIRDRTHRSNGYSKCDISKRRITLCEEHRILRDEYAASLSPCDSLPFDMAFIFDPTIRAEVTHYTNMRHTLEKESGVVQSTYFVAVFNGMEIFSIRELVEAFFRAYLEKTEEEIEDNHPFPLVVPPKKGTYHEVFHSTWAKKGTLGHEEYHEKDILIPVELVSPRAFLEAREHHRLLDGPVQQVLVCDKELGVMALGRAIDKRIIGPPSRPPTGAMRSMESKELVQSRSQIKKKKPHVILELPSPILPPFKLRHLTGAIVEAVGLFTRPYSSVPEFRVRCSANDDDDVQPSQWTQKSRRKREREDLFGTTHNIMTLEDAHQVLSGAQEKERSKGNRGSQDTSFSFSDNENPTTFDGTVDAFRLNDEMGPTLGWLLRFSTAFVFS